MMSRIGVVLIGRNEGPRLVRALDSVMGDGWPVVYVDSGSTDDSCTAARERGVLVVDLDMTRPFTAARARNAGFARLMHEHPTTELVLFIDGDCEVLPGFVRAAVAELDADPGVLAVCGWRRERHPERTVYNRICDVEWRWGELGSIPCFGGDVLVRAAAVRAIGGYDPEVIAAEDDEIGVRLRQLGGRLVRIDHDSTLHDADMGSAKQWWQRAKRCGYAYAQVSAIHGAPPERKFIDELRRTMLWGLLAPAAALALTLPTLGLSWLVFGRYPAVVAKVARLAWMRGFSWDRSLVWGVSCALAPFPAAVGVAKFHLDRMRSKHPQIIEYK
jgi:glycosyltransferase involved in cell wall biosynthesis